MEKYLGSDDDIDKKDKDDKDDTVNFYVNEETGFTDHSMLTLYLDVEKLSKAKN